LRTVGAKQRWQKKSLKSKNCLSLKIRRSSQVRTLTSQNASRILRPLPQKAPKSPQIRLSWKKKVQAGGAGRTAGLTDEKARIERIVKNEVPDPTIKFAFECLFEGWENAVKVKGLALSKDETNAIAVPVTNLKEYYLPGLDLSPSIRMWIGLAIGVKAVVQSRIELIRETRKAEQVTQPEQPGDEQKT